MTTMPGHEDTLEKAAARRARYELLQVDPLSEKFIYAGIVMAFSGAALAAGLGERETAGLGAGIGGFLGLLAVTAHYLKSQFAQASAVEVELKRQPSFAKHSILHLD